jgi:UDP-N-acetylmuramoyl-tripeptide--D-alanyl-D-alanine ligase
LAGLGTAKTLGVNLEKAAEGLAAAAPHTGRMSPWPLQNGAVLLRDDYNGSVDSFDRAVQVLRDARAVRKILVISDCSDFRPKPRRRMYYYADVAREVADMVVFIGERCEQGVERAVRQGMPPQGARGFYDFISAAGFLKNELRSGDLVLIRGQAFHHLGRIGYLLEGEIGCKRAHCELRILCDVCPKLQFRRTTRAE